MDILASPRIGAAMQAMQEDMDRLQEDLESREAVAEKRAQECKAGRQRREGVLLTARQNLEDVIRLSDEAARAGAERLDEAVRYIEEASKKREEAALEMETAAKMLQKGALQMKAAAKTLQEAALVKVGKAKEALRQGIGPVVMPTPKQIFAAKQRIQYKPKKIHFAVCGVSGSGKSTLINAFRGLSSTCDGAARVGVTECTSKITRYPDLRKHKPYSRFVWYDFPGAGTKEVSDWQYFNDQGLFVFDFIILVYNVGFTEMDVGIVKNCLRFNIPVFIVRRKADRHMGYTMQEHKDYAETTRSDFDKHMQTMAEGPELDARDRQLLLGQRVYIVAAGTLHRLLQYPTSVWRGQELAGCKIIDETLLIEDMLRAAATRRFPTKKPAEDVQS